MGTKLKAEDYNKNKKYELIAVFAVFLLNILLRFLTGNFPRMITVYPDELRYVGIARSIAEGGYTIRGLGTDFQKILYSLALLPAGLIQSGQAQNTVILLLNCVYMSAAVFPAWLLARRLGLTRRAMAGTAVLFLAFSDHLYTMTYMSETVYLPLLLTAVALTARLFEEGDFRRRAALGAGVGAVYYLLYLTKEIALSLVVAYAAAAFAEILFTRDRRRKKQELAVCLSVLAAFLLLFAAFKLTLFDRMGNSYDQMGLSAILSRYNLLYCIYGALYYFICILLAMGVFPVIIPLAGLPDYKREDRRIVLYVMLTLAVSVGVVAYTITVREDLGTLAPRQHMRYVYPLLLPLFMLTLKWFGTQGRTDRRSIGRIALLTAVAAALVVFGFRGIGLGPCVDQTPLKLIERLTAGQRILNGGAGQLQIGMAEAAVKAAAVALCAGVVLALYLLPRKGVYVVTGLAVALNLANTAAGYGEFRSRYEIDANTQGEMEELNEFLFSLEGNIVCVVPENAGAWGLTDTFLGFGERATVSAVALERMTAEQPFVDLGESRLPGLFPYVPYEDIQTVDYVVLSRGAGSLRADSAEDITPEGINLFRVYRNLEKDRLYYQGCMPRRGGERTVIRPEDGLLYSKYPLTDGSYVSGETPDYLIYGPYLPLKAGEYSVEIFYSCEAAPEEAGTADVLCESLSCEVSSPVRADQASVRLDFTLTGDCGSVEFRMLTARPDIRFEYLTVTKIK